jgi:hypothetical protein
MGIYKSIRIKETQYKRLREIGRGLIFFRKDKEGYYVKAAFLQGQMLINKVINK